MESKDYTQALIQTLYHGGIKDRSFGEGVSRVQDALLASKRIYNVSKYIYSIIASNLGFAAPPKEVVLEEENDKAAGNPRISFYSGFFEMRLWLEQTPDARIFWSYYRIATRNTFNIGGANSYIFYDNNGHPYEIKIDGIVAFTKDYFIKFSYNNFLSVYYKTIEEPKFNIKALMIDALELFAVQREKEQILLLIAVKFDVTRVFSLDMNGKLIHLFSKFNNYVTGIGYQGILMKDGQFIDYFTKKRVKYPPLPQTSSSSLKTQIEGIDIISPNEESQTGAVYDVLNNQLLWLISSNEDYIVFDSFIFYRRKNIIDLITGITLIVSSDIIGITRKEDNSGYYLWIEESEEMSEDIIERLKEKFYEINEEEFLF